MAYQPRPLIVERIDDDLPLGIHAAKHAGDVGLDLEAMEDMVIAPMQAVDVKVNARIQLPEGTWAQMLARSSIAKRNLQVEAGVIDNGYRGPLFVVLRNMNMPPLTTNIWTDPAYRREETNREGQNPDASPWIRVKAGERVAQLVIHRLHPVNIIEGAIEVLTSRGEAGFGSTGR